MHVSVVGSGYVGTTLAACLAELGHDVVAIDIDETVVDALNDGRVTIHEPGLAELVATHAGDGLRATTEHAEIRETELTFLAVETPARADGSLDASALVAATGDVGTAIADGAGDHLVVVKSTVLPDVIEDEVRPALEAAAGRSVGADLALAVNPEFLREGSAVEDFFAPDKLVFGADDARAHARLRDLYEPLLARHDAAVVETDRATAAMIKYVNNAFLATKLSFINDVGNLCKLYGIDTYEVADAIGLDHRIEGSFLRSGAGYGGSCFPKDTAALVAAGRRLGYEPAVVAAAMAVNEDQPRRLLGLLEAHVDVADARVAVLGLAFKPGTDDIRESRAIPVVEGLLERGATVVAYDPNEGAVAAMRERFPSVEYAPSAGVALAGADAACVVTDWPEFADLDGAFDAMNEPVVVDGRRIVARRDGLVYEGLTW